MSLMLSHFSIKLGQWSNCYEIDICCSSTKALNIKSKTKSKDLVAYNRASASEYSDMSTHRLCMFQ